MRCLLVVASAAALRPSNAPLPLVEKSRRAFGAAAVASAFAALPANAFSAAYLPAILVPVMCLVMPVLGMGLFTILTQKEEL